VIEMVFIKKVKDVEFLYEKCQDGTFKVIAHSDAQQKSAILSYEKDLNGVNNCIKAFETGFNLGGFILKL
jgi:hypothetical protein